MKNDSTFKMKGKRSYPDKNSAYLADRGTPAMGSKSYTGGEPSAFLAKRSEPAKGSATFNSRY